MSYHLGLAPSLSSRWIAEDRAKFARGQTFHVNRLEFTFTLRNQPQAMDRLNATIRNHLNISDTITSSIGSLSFSKIKMISGLAPLNGLDIRSYIPDPIQPLILLSYPITMAGELVESGMGARNGGSVPAHWAEAVDSGLGSPSSILSPASTPSALRKTVAKLLQEVPLLDKVFTSTWLDAGSSSAVDTASNHLTRAYGKGPKDALFVLFCAIAWTLLREATMRYAFQPLMRQRLNQLDARSKKDESEKSVKAGGGEKQTASWKREMRLREKTITRFAEQGWAFSYCVTFFSLGIVSCCGKSKNVGLRFCSVFSSNPTNGPFHQHIYGETTPTPHYRASQNSTISPNSVSGAISCSSSTLKSGARITGRCTRITASPSCSSLAAIGQTLPESAE